VDVLLRRGASECTPSTPAMASLPTGCDGTRASCEERTNAMHIELPEPADLVTIDVAWTPQRYILPAAMRLLKTEGASSH